MNLVEAFNIINNAARSVQADGNTHDRIRVALDTIAPIIKTAIEAEQQAIQDNKE